MIDHKDIHIYNTADSIHPWRPRTIRLHLYIGTHISIIF